MYNTPAFLYVHCAILRNWQEKVANFPLFDYFLRIFCEYNIMYMDETTTLENYKIKTFITKYVRRVTCFCIVIIL